MGWTLMVKLNYMILFQIYVDQNKLDNKLMQF